MVYFIDSSENSISHVGTPHEGSTPHSGRYPWGSGENGYQHLKDFRDRVNKMKADGISEKQIVQEFGFETTTELRDYVSLAGTKIVSMETSRVKSYRDRGWSTHKIAEQMGISEATVRNRLKPEADRKATKLESTVNTLKAQVGEKEFLDVSAGTEQAMGVSEGVKQKAIRALKMEGYDAVVVKTKQLGTGNMTDTLVLIPPGKTWKDAYQNQDQIKPFSGSVEDNKVTPNGWVKPLAIDPDRVMVRYKEDGGHLKDGTIDIRPGVADLDMGGNTFTQARIQVGDKHYLKGIAILEDNMPDGYDIVFNTNKSRSKGKEGSMKELKTLPNGKVDWDNPFGSTIRQQIKTEDGKKAASAINIVNDEDDWDDWSKNLSKQFLSKQSIPLARSQLELTRASKQSDLDEILALTNPVVKKNLLLKFADSADSEAEYLKAAALPNQKTHVILPINSLKDTEVFAPNYKNGERLVLIRYPHGGTFEIPELVVNNKNKEGVSKIGLDSKVGMGINAKVAERLSGADFDGDTVVAIPNNSGRVISKKALEGLKDYDPKDIYGPPDNFDSKNPPYAVMKKASVGTEMGKISNLITDMTIKGANDDEIARAVRHSMTVIDAEKHKLDYRRSYEDNDIKDLQKRYQDKGTGTYGASTLISRSRGQKDVEELKLRGYRDGGPIDPKTGELVYVPTGRTIRKKNPVTGEWEDTGRIATQKVTQMRLVKDAHELSSGSPMEELYADHANAMKSMGNKARLEYTRTPKFKRDPEAAATYKTEVEELTAALRKAQANAPRERHAQRIANAIVAQKKADNPVLATREHRDDLKKVEARALKTARERAGADKDKIYPTDRQWEAVQSGAVSESLLQDILKHADDERIRELATPRQTNELNKSQQSLIRSMSNSGFTNAEIAEKLGVSVATVNKYK